MRASVPRLRPPREIPGDRFDLRQDLRFREQLEGEVELDDEQVGAVVEQLERESEAAATICFVLATGFHPSSTVRATGLSRSSKPPNK